MPTVGQEEDERAVEAMLLDWLGVRPELPGAIWPVVTASMRFAWDAGVKRCEERDE